VALGLARDAARRTEVWAAGLFVAGAVSQYIGAAIAVDLFATVPAQCVAWLRVCGAAVVLVVVARPWRRPWTRRALGIAAAFGAITAAMNTCFYLAADRLPLGTTVAIEFAGPITVAALSLRTRRSLAALVLAGGGVALLSGVELSNTGHSAAGVGFALGAAACWAGYIVLGARVSTVTEGVDGLAVALLFGAVAIAPVGAPASGPAFTSPHRLLLCVVVGVLSTALPYGIDQVVLRRVDRGTFALLLALLPTTATIVGAVRLDQRLRGSELVGVAAVVVALLVRGSDAGVDAAAAASPP
jgi:inner membrane transporter RhtA